MRTPISSPMESLISGRAIAGLAALIAAVASADAGAACPPGEDGVVKSTEKSVIVHPRAAVAVTGTSKGPKTFSRVVVTSPDGKPTEYQYGSDSPGASPPGADEKVEIQWESRDDGQTKTITRFSGKVVVVGPDGQVHEYAYGDGAAEPHGMVWYNDALRQLNDRIISLESLPQLRTLVPGQPLMGFGATAGEPWEFHVQEFAPGQPLDQPVAQPAEPPKAMIGVQLAQPDANVLAHFGLDGANVTLISAVYKGFPADLAGLGPTDLIVSFDGSKDAGQQRVRELMRSKNPGDTVRLGVIQKGQRRDVNLTLQPYDAQRLESAEVLGMPATVTMMTTPGDGSSFYGLAAPQQEAFRTRQGTQPFYGLQTRPNVQEEMSKGVQAAIEALKKALEDGSLDQATRETLKQSMEEAKKALELSKKEISAYADAARRALSNAQPFVGRMRSPDGNEQDLLFVTPDNQLDEEARKKLAEAMRWRRTQPDAAAPSDPNAVAPPMPRGAIARRVAPPEHDAQVKRLEERLERLEAMIQRLIEQGQQGPRGLNTTPPQPRRSIGG